MACCDSIIQYRLTACAWSRKSTDYWLTSSCGLLCAFLARGLKMASKEIKDVNDSDGKEENYQRQLTLLNEAVDGSCNFFPVLSGPFPTPGHEERDNSPPPGSWSTSDTFLRVHLLDSNIDFRTIAKRDVFRTSETFYRVYWERVGADNVIRSCRIIY